MTQNKNEVKKDADEKYKDIELTDARIERDSQGGILDVHLKGTCCFFIESVEGAKIRISFSYDNGIEIVSRNDEGETEIKVLRFQSLTKNKKLEVKLNKLLDGVTISNGV